MQWKHIFIIVSQLLFFLTIAMLLPIFFSFYYKDNNHFSFIISSSSTLITSIIFYLISKKNKNLKKISQKEGMAIVSIGWIMTSIFGSLPFYLSIENFSFINSFFESVSGFTTTGATVINNIESIPKSLLLWRSFIQWLGGMGIIVLSIAILPGMKINKKKLYNAEVPSPIPDKLKPKIKDTAIILWTTYIILSIIEAILLKLAGLDFFNTLCHTFTTMPTGGFSTMNSSIKGFNNIYIELIITIFMLSSGINFSLYYQMIKNDKLALWKNFECKFFITLVSILIIITSINNYGKVYSNMFESFRFSTFQVISIITSTGYITADYELWSPLSKLIIFICMFTGSSAGSTSGGIKCLRIIICLKYSYKELFSILHPRAVTHIKVDKKPVPKEIIKSILAFVNLYITLFVIFSILLTTLNIDLYTSISSVAACLGNTGPAFGSVGPTENYASIPPLGKLILSFCMLLGRLEIYTIIVIILPEFWRK